MNNEKTLEFIKADWDAKKKAFDAALVSPFNAFVVIDNQTNQLPLVEPSPVPPRVPSTFPSTNP